MRSAHACNQTLVGKSVLAIMVVMIVSMCLLFVAVRATLTTQLTQDFEASSQIFSSFLADQINTGTRLKRGAMIDPQLSYAVATEGLSIAALRVTHTDGILVSEMTSDAASATALQALSAPDFTTALSATTQEGYLLVRLPIRLGSG